MFFGDKFVSLKVAGNCQWVMRGVAIERAGGKVNSGKIGKKKKIEN